MKGFIVNHWIQFFSTVVIGYILGSINFSIIVTRIISKSTDIRDMGSGNAGFTNVLRSVGKTAAIITFTGDILKSAIAILIGRSIFLSCGDTSIPEFYIYQFGAYVAGISCVVGHIYPCFFRFKGGKGVLTLFAMIFFIDLRSFFILLAMFCIMLICFRIISLSSIVSAAFYPVITFLVGYLFDYFTVKGEISIGYIATTTIASMVMSMLVIYKHGKNIKRLIKGEEKKVSMKRK